MIRVAGISLGWPTETAALAIIEAEGTVEVYEINDLESETRLPMRREVPIEGSELPDQYRASYSRLLDYTPLFRPWLEAMQRDLLQQSRHSAVSAEVQTMITALEHYMSAVESARAFVNSVVSPPMELVFHDTESFQEEWKLLDGSRIFSNNWPWVSTRRYTSCP